MLSSINSITELEKYLEIICDICANTREIYGTNESIILYRNLIYKVESDFPEYQSVIHWAWIIISYANLLYENCDYKQAIICVKNLLLYWPESNINNKNSIIYCYLYNRLHVYKRALNKYVTSNSLEWLRKSEILQNTSEVEFLNLVDRGYCNYDCIKSKNKIIFYWESACKIYEKNNILTKKVNYFYIKIRLHLFNKEWNAASKTIETALSTIEVKEEGTYYFTYFKQRYLICKIALLLLNYNSSKKNIIDELFYEVETINYILKSRMIYSIQFLKSIYCFYNKQYLDSFLCIQSSIDELYKSKKLTFQNFYIEQIYENIDYFMANAFFDDVTNIDIKELSNNNIIIRLKKIMKQSLEKNLNIIENHQCTGLLQSDDCKINFPIL